MTISPAARCCPDRARSAWTTPRTGRGGARVLPRTEVLSASRNGAAWRVLLSNGEQLGARAIVNAAGPWVKRVLNERLGQPAQAEVRLVQGSHIVVPGCYPGEHAFILQNDDGRVVFMIPFEERFTLIGTTDVALEGDPAAVRVHDEEVAYLCRAVNRYLARPVGA